MGVVVAVDVYIAVMVIRVGVVAFVCVDVVMGVGCVVWVVRTHTLHNTQFTKHTNSACNTACIMRCGSSGACL